MDSNAGLIRDDNGYHPLKRVMTEVVADAVS